jgi:hypothetical protein
MISDAKGSAFYRFPTLELRQNQPVHVSEFNI